MRAEVFRQVQRVPRAWRVVAAGVGAAVVGWVGVGLGDATGATAVAVAVAAVVAFATAARLEASVLDDRIEIRWFPLWRRTIALGDVEAAEAVRYHPLREFGGWGIRWGWRGGWAYSIAGDLGVDLRLRGDRRVVIGSRDPEPLAAAIDDGIERVRPSH
ncbi:MAG TPA: hypothetical protein VLA82_02710 [Actinomycetota bacterium]|nr:hypothetical protein [Actinomycetota bacterium]